MKERSAHTRDPRPYQSERGARTMTIFLTGANGFIGSYLLRALVDAGHRVRCLLRDPHVRLSVEGPEVDKVQGDVLRPESLADAVQGCDAVIHLVGIIDEDPARGLTFEAVHYEGTKHVVAAAAAAGVERFLHMSANGARPDGVSGYQTSKWKAEEHVRNAAFRHWTIFRPSLVFGDPGPDHPEFATRLAKTLVRPFPVLPVFGDGQYRLQPISIEEVVAAFVQALAKAETAGKTYCVAGKEAFTYNEVLDRIALGLGLAPKPKVKQPLWLVRPVIRSVGRLGVLPISLDQFEMLIEGNTCDSTAFYRDFDVTFKPFTPENLAYLKVRT